MRGPLDDLNLGWMKPLSLLQTFADFEMINIAVYQCKGVSDVVFERLCQAIETCFVQIERSQDLPPLRLRLLRNVVLSSRDRDQSYQDIFASLRIHGFILVRDHSKLSNEDLEIVLHEIDNHMYHSESTDEHIVRLTMSIVDELAPGLSFNVNDFLLEERLFSTSQEDELHIGITNELNRCIDELIKQLFQGFSIIIKKLDDSKVHPLFYDSEINLSDQRRFAKRYRHARVKKLIGDYRLLLGEYSLAYDCYIESFQNFNQEDDVFLSSTLMCISAVSYATRMEEFAVHRKLRVNNLGVSPADTLAMIIDRTKISVRRLKDLNYSELASCYYLLTADIVGAFFPLIKNDLDSLKVVDTEEKEQIVKLLTSSTGHMNRHFVVMDMVNSAISCAPEPVLAKTYQRAAAVCKKHEMAQRHQNFFLSSAAKLLLHSRPNMSIHIIERVSDFYGFTLGQTKYYWPSLVSSLLSTLCKAYVTAEVHDFTIATFYALRRLQLTHYDMARDDQLSFLNSFRTYVSQLSLEPIFTNLLPIVYSISICKSQTDVQYRQEAFEHEDARPIFISRERWTESKASVITVDSVIPISIWVTNPFKFDLVLQYIGLNVCIAETDEEAKYSFLTPRMPILKPGERKMMTLKFIPQQVGEIVLKSLILQTLNVRLQYFICPNGAFITDQHRVLAPEEIGFKWTVLEPLPVLSFSFQNWEADLMPSAVKEVLLPITNMGPGVVRWFEIKQRVFTKKGLIVMLKTPKEVLERPIPPFSTLYLEFDISLQNETVDVGEASMDIMYSHSHNAPIYRTMKLSFVGTRITDECESPNLEFVPMCLSCQFVILRVTNHSNKTVMYEYGNYRISAVGDMTVQLVVNTSNPVITYRILNGYENHTGQYTVTNIDELKQTLPKMALCSSVFPLLNTKFTSLSFNGRFWYCPGQKWSKHDILECTFKDSLKPLFPLQISLCSRLAVILGSHIINSHSDLLRIKFFSPGTYMLVVYTNSNHKEEEVFEFCISVE
ncbi:hypothetical protein PCE1_001053 [Barthelona sp. PCE]